MITVNLLGYLSVFRNKIFMFMLVVFLKVYKRKKISGRIHKKKTVCV